ncbi:MAG: hypothetical protein ACKOE4_06630 [Candidatus Kapaibacterium sp.]
MNDYLRSQTIVDDVENVISLLSAEGGEVSASLVDRIRRTYGNAEQAQIVIELALGTSRARSMGKYRPGWLFTRRMAEQATHPMLARYHAEVFRGLNTVLEICTGPGIDAAALAEVAGRVVSIEADEQICAIASGNLRRHGASNVEVVLGRWPDAGLADHQWDGVWADPSRRSEGRRVFDARQYEPPLASIPSARVVGVKAGPGDAIPDTAYASEYIGVGSECRERILWSAGAGKRPLVTLLADDGVVGAWSPADGELSAQPPVVSTGAYLIEPHNAIIASGAVSAYFSEQGAGVLDPRIGYGICDTPPDPSPWCSVYAIESITPGVSVRRMQEEVVRLGWGSGTVIKKRGWDKDPEAVRGQLRFVDGGPEGAIIIARVGDSHLTIFATSLARPGFR